VSALDGASPSWLCARSDLRRRWKASLAIAALIGVAGAVVLTAYAGAQRTGSAYPRYLQATHAADFLVATESSGTAANNRFYREVEAVRSVARSGVALGPSIVSVSATGQIQQSEATQVQTFASEDGRDGYTVSGFKLLAGRMPQPDHEFEALVNRTLAIQRHLHVGSRLSMYAVNTNASPAVQAQEVRRERPVTFTITGIGVSYDEVVPIAPNDGLPTLFLTSAYYRAHHAPAETNFDGVFVRLRPGASTTAFSAAVTALFRADKMAAGLGGLFIADLALHQARVERAIHPEALALELFALFVALGAVLIIGQVLGREVQLSSVDDRALRAIGFDQRQLVSAKTARLAVPVVLGAALSVAGAVAASPLMPIGPARVAEPHPGFSADWVVLGTGFVAVIAVFGVLCMAWAWFAARSSAPGADGEDLASKPWKAAETFGRAGLSPAAVSGLGMAFMPGRGQAAVPVRSTFIGAALAVAAVVGALTFGASLGHLVSTPSLYGVTWDMGLDAQFQAISRAQIVAAARQLPGVIGVAGGTYGDDVSLDGQSVPAVGIDSIKGSVFPTIVQGTRPLGTNEIALGAETMRDLGKGIGDWVRLSTSVGPKWLKVVGQVVFPSFGRGSFTPTDLGEGAVTAAAVIAQLPAGAARYNFMLLRVSDRARSTAAQALADVAHRSGCPADQCLLTSQRLLPSDIQAYNRVKATPLYLGGILGFFGAAMIGHALITSVRRRRRDLALLKTLGFSTRQVAGAVAWQASAFALVAILFGFPAGVVLGHWLWSIFASQIGVPDSWTFPLRALLIVPATLVLANLIAVLPARSAARTRAALVLRTE
jgi:hypothetical protein